MIPDGQREGDREVAAILPSGRTVWLRVARPLASAASIQNVARLAERESDRRASEIAEQARATERLSGATVAAFDRLRRTRTARIRALRRRMWAGDDRLDARLAKAREELQSRLDKQFEIDRENLRRLRRRGLWDNILVATALPLFAAYGERSSPFGTNNLTLAFLLLIWLAGDQVVEAVFGSGSSKSRYAVADTDVWSYLAPAANVLAAWWLLGGRQHERFVTGVTTVTITSYRSRVSVSLQDRMGADHYSDFETFADVPVVATIGSVRLSALGASVNAQLQTPKARVKAGELKLSLSATAQGPPLPPEANLGDVDIAWMVDTNEPCQNHRH